MSAADKTKQYPVIVISHRAQNKKRWRPFCLSLPGFHSESLIIPQRGNDPVVLPMTGRREQTASTTFKRGWGEQEKKRMFLLHCHRREALINPGLQRTAVLSSSAQNSSSPTFGETISQAAFYRLRFLISDLRLLFLSSEAKKKSWHFFDSSFLVTGLCWTQVKLRSRRVCMERLASQRVLV